MMLPIPTVRYIPKFYRDNLDNAMEALTNKMDDLFLEWKNDILSLNNLLNPLKCPNKFLPELSYYLNAGIFDYDSETTKRKKIYYAIQSHINRGTWEDDAKLKIDAITGLSAAIFRAIDSDDCIEMGDPANDPDYYWSTEGSPGFGDDNLGTWEVGDFTEYVIAGIIYIDCHEGINVSTLTSAQIEQIVFELAFDIAPAYYRIYLGYVDVAGAFVKYAGGVID